MPEHMHEWKLVRGEDCYCVCGEKHPHWNQIGTTEEQGLRATIAAQAARIDELEASYDHEKHVASHWCAVASTREQRIAALTQERDELKVELAEFAAIADALNDWDWGD